MNTSVGRQFMAGFLPGILIAFVLSVYVYFRCRNMGIAKRPKYTSAQILSIVKDSLLALLFPVIVLGGIYGGFTTPTEAAAVSLIYVILIEVFVFRKLTISDIGRVLAKSAATGAALVFIIACASVFNWFMTIQQVPMQMSALIQSIIHTKTMFIFALTAFLFVAGCFMDLISLIVVLGPILQPTLNHFGLDLIHFGIICIINCEVAFMTPPFGVNLFVTMSITRESLYTVAKATLPYMLIFLGMALVMAFIPEISLVLPNWWYR
jgi:C4-dicarboxylate transporter DctM subunit